MRGNKALRYFLIGQASLYLGFLISIFLRPYGWFANYGISYYSSSMPTALPFTICLVIMGIYVILLAEHLPETASRGFRYIPWVIAVFLLAVAAMPYGINATIMLSHRLLGGGLFLVQYVFVWWVTLFDRSDVVEVILLMCITLAGYVTLSYLSPHAGHLTWGEMSFQIIFTIATYRAIRKYDTVGIATPKAEQTTTSAPATVV